VLRWKSKPRSAAGDYVATELARREGTSGINEKKGRRET